MIAKWVNARGSNLNYICASTDDKPANADVGARLFTYDDGANYIFDGENWQTYVDPKLSTANNE